MLYGFLIGIHVIVSIVLILVILLQAGRGGGLSESFGVSSTQTLFGTSATKFLQRATSVCAVIFLLTCLSLAALSTKRSSSLMERQKFATQAVPARTEQAKQAPAGKEAVPAAKETGPKEAAASASTASEKK